MRSVSAYRDCKGRFVRIHKPWSPENMEDGYIDSSGRFRVYFPGHHRASKGGYVLRSIIHYEWYNETVVLIGNDVHHKDGNRLNDSYDNLLLLDHVEHSKLHHPKKDTTMHCLNCKKGFKIKTWRLKSKKENRGKFCSTSCFQKRDVSKATRLKMSNSRKIRVWSIKHKSCICCGTKEKKHVGNGLCSVCYLRRWRRGGKN